MSIERKYWYAAENIKTLNKELVLKLKILSYGDTK